MTEGQRLPHLILPVTQRYSPYLNINLTSWPKLGKSFLASSYAPLSTNSATLAPFSPNSLIHLAFLSSPSCVPSATASKLMLNPAISEFRDCNQIIIMLIIAIAIIEIMLKPAILSIMAINNIEIKGF